MEPAPSPVRRAIAVWQDALLDLRTSNPMLNLDPGAGALRLVQPAPEAVWAYLLLGDRVAPLRLVPAADAAEAGVCVAEAGRGRVADVLRDMRQEAEVALVEQGVHLLFAAFGLLAWTSAEHGALSSPLFLLPVRLERPNPLADYHLAPLAAEPAPVFNPALALKLRAERGLTLALPPAHAGLAALVEAVRGQIAGERDWLVESRVALGPFPFDKYAIHEDLVRRAAELELHPLVRALAGDEEARRALPQERGRPADALDEVEDPAAVFQVLDADASQRRAIDAVKRGSSLVVQGPPGTGKSQTIANLIAECLGQGKSVLFVSEKLAALRVVAQRLEAVGLGDACLQVHDEAKGLEAGIVARLRSALEEGRSAGARAATGAGAPTGTEATDPARLWQLRRELSGYLAALCAPAAPFGRSAYEVMGEIARLQNAGAPALRFDYDPARMGELDPDKRAQLDEALRRLMLVAETVRRPEDNPWARVEVRQVQRDPAVRLQWRERLQALAAAAGELDKLQVALRAAWGLPDGRALTDADRLAALLGDVAGRGNAAALASWFGAAGFGTAAEIAGSYADGLGPTGKLREELQRRWTPAVLDRGVLDAIDREVTAAEPILELLPGTGSQAPAVPVSARVAAGVLRGELEELRAVGGRVAEVLGLPAPRTVRQAEFLDRLANLLAGGRPVPRAWFRRDAIAGLRALALAAVDRATDLARRPALAARFRPAFFDLAADDERLGRLGDDDLGGHLMARLHADLLRLERTGYADEDLDRDEARALIRRARAVREAEAWFAAHADALDAAFGGFYTGPEGNWQALVDALDAVEGCLATGLIDRQRPPAAVVDMVPPAVRDRRFLLAFGEALAQADSAKVLFLATCPDDLRPPEPFEEQPFAALAESLERLLLGSPHLAEPTRALAACRHATWVTFQDLLDDLAAARRVNELEEALAARFGPSFHGPDTDWTRILRSLAWVGRVRAHFAATGDPPPVFVDRVVGQGAGVGTDDAARLATGIAQVREALARLRDLLLPTSPLRRSEIAALGLDRLAAWARQLLDELPRLDDWLVYRQAIQRAGALGLERFVEAVRAAPEVPVASWPAGFELQLLTLWLAWRQRQAPELAEFYRPDVERRIAEFRALDRRQVATAAGRLRARLAARRAELVRDPAVGAEVAAVLAAAHGAAPAPLRPLFERLGNSLEVLTPCLLMSPKAVARYLGASPVVFDVVVFDEASQVVPADAIGAIGRGKQVVVVGDAKQLPPTGFFRAAGPGGEDGRDAESLLGAAMTAGLPETKLTWHYRSRHEHLIAFSNRAFYGNELVTFPDARADVDPVELIDAGGTYGEGERNANPKEAEALVRLVAEQARRAPHLRIGAIAFSREQAQAILRGARPAAAGGTGPGAPPPARCGRRPVRPQPRDRPGGRGRRRLPVRRLRPARPRRADAHQLRPAQPGGRRAPAQRGDHAGAGADGGPRLVPAGAAAGGAAGAGPAARLPRLRPQHAGRGGAATAAGPAAAATGLRRRGRRGARRGGAAGGDRRRIGRVAVGHGDRGRGDRPIPGRDRVRRRGLPRRAERARPGAPAARGAGGDGRGADRRDGVAGGAPGLGGGLAERPGGRDRADPAGGGDGAAQTGRCGARRGRGAGRAAGLADRRTDDGDGHGRRRHHRGPAVGGDARGRSDSPGRRTGGRPRHCRGRTAARCPGHRAGRGG